MTSIEKIKLHKPTPTTVLVNAGNQIGVELVRTLLEHEGFVVVVDRFTDENLNRFGEFISSAYFLYLDNSGIDSLKNLTRVDYIIDFLQEIDPKSNIGSDEFLKHTNFLNSVISLAEKFDSKYELVTSILNYRFLIRSKYSLEIDAVPYSGMELQRYAENYIAEQVQKLSFDGRIVRLGEIIGSKIDLNKNTDLTNFIKSAITSNPLKIYGDGLELQYYVHISDAVSGIIKAIFSKKAKGKIYNFCYPDETTILSLAYKIKSLEPNSGESLFVENSKHDNLPGLPASIVGNSEIGWLARVSLEKGLAESIDSAVALHNATAGIVSGVNEFDPVLAETSKRKLSYVVEDIQAVTPSKIATDQFDRFRVNDVVVNKDYIKEEVPQVEKKVISNNNRLNFEERLKPPLKSALKNISTTNKVVNNEVPVPKFVKNYIPENTSKRVNSVMKKKVSFIQLAKIFSLILFLGAILYLLVFSPIIERSRNIENVKQTLEKASTSEFLNFSAINGLNEDLSVIKSSSSSWVMSKLYSDEERGLIQDSQKVVVTMSQINIIRDKLQSYMKPDVKIKYNFLAESIEIYSKENQLLGQVYMARFDYDGIKKQIETISKSPISKTTLEPYASIYSFYQKKYIPYWNDVSKQSF